MCDGWIYVDSDLKSDIVIKNNNKYYEFLDELKITWLFTISNKSIKVNDHDISNIQFQSIAEILKKVIDKIKDKQPEIKFNGEVILNYEYGGKDKIVVENNVVKICKSIITFTEPIEI